MDYFSNGTSSSTTNIMTCELHPNASIKWQKYFHEIDLGLNHFTIRCLLSELIPTGVIILFNSYIVYHVVRLYHRLHRTRNYQPHNRQSRTTSWMNIVLILHSTLFLSSLFAHIIGHFTVVEAHETWWILLSVLINCSLNFYVYCLSGKAFRNEIRRFIQRCKIRLSYTLQACRQRSPDRRASYEMNNLQVLVQIKDISPDNLIDGLFI